MNTLILLSLLGVLALLSEIFNFKRLLYPLVLAGLGTALYFTISDFNTNVLFFNMLLFDNYSLSFTAVIIVTAILWFLMANSFVNDDSFNKTNYYALVLFAMVGAVIMTSYTNMAMLFLGIEILSIPMYVLAGSNKSSLASNEAAFKYLIMGAFATGILLFGVALVYGATQSFDLNEIQAAYETAGADISPIFYVGVLMIFVAMSFKVSAAPFHFWAPDVYQGSPTEVTALMATVVKTAAFAAFIRLFHSSFSGTSEIWINIAWVISALTLLLGNMTAVVQDNVKRLLAYSSVAHAGYMFIALIADNEYSHGAILYYLLVYSVGSIATFTVLRLFTQFDKEVTISSFNGLAKANPLLAVTMTIALFSLAGIPPAAGFFAKYYIFTSAFYAGYTILVLIAIVSSLVGVYYYLKLIIAMFAMKRDENAPHVYITSGLKILLYFLCFTIIVIGLFPDMIIKLL